MVHTQTDTLHADAHILDKEPSQSSSRSDCTSISVSSLNRLRHCWAETKKHMEVQLRWGAVQLKQSAKTVSPDSLKVFISVLMRWNNDSDGVMVHTLAVKLETKPSIWRLNVARWRNMLINIFMTSLCCIGVWCKSVSVLYLFASFLPSVLIYTVF